MNQNNNVSYTLSLRQRQTVAAFAEVFIEGEEEIISPHEIMENIDRYIGKLESNRKRSLQFILFLIEHVLPRLSLWPFVRSFSRMSPSKRKKLIKRKLLQPRQHGINRDLAKIRTLFAQGYYGDPRVFNSIGFITVKDRPKYRPDKLKPLGLPELRLTPPDPGGMDCDVCVIGSGAGGAVVAQQAAARVKKVLVIEEGPYLPGKEISHDESDMVARLYKEGGVQTTVDFDMTIVQGKCLGGTTVINNAICFELNSERLNPASGPEVLTRWQQEFDAPIDRVQLNESYTRVKETIGVNLLPEIQDHEVPDISGNNWTKFNDGWKALVKRNPELAKYKSGLFAKNLHRCLGCGYCNYGCPYERKRSMLETYLAEAVKTGNARLVINCHAVKIETRRGQATGIHCQLKDGQKMFVRAKSVVVSGGAIGSSVLLLKSGIRENVGKNFSFNAATTLLAHFPQPLRSFDGVQMAGYVDAGDFLLETLFNPPMTFSLILPGWFEAHFARMRDYAYFANAGVVVGTEANGRVKKSAFFRNLLGPVKYNMTHADLEKLKKGLTLLAQVYFAAGADTVYPGTFVDSPLSAQRYAGNPGALAKFFKDNIKKPDDLILNSAHPQGGNPMSNDRKKGVVDSQFRVHGFNNLYVCDASIFPTSIGINPQLTIMAMADYFSNLGLL
jgi:choline dehydrogenase-like flavoprotein